MMTDDQLSLITAAVDGELNPTETLRFRRLLDSSCEARGFYVRLKSDSTRLRNLPHLSPPAHLRQRVMTQIATLTPSPIVPRESANPPQSAEPSSSAFAKRKSKSHRWVPVAVAASLLIGIMGSSFWFFSRTGGKAENLARHTPDRPPPATHSGADDPNWVKWLPPESEKNLTVPTPNVGSQTDLQIAQNNSGIPSTLPVGTMPVAIAPEPRLSHNSSIMGAEVRSEISPLDLIRVRVPFLKSLAEFDREDTRQQFAEELARDPAFRIDIFARNMPRSVEWFCSAAKSAGVTLFVDSTTLERVKKGQLNSVVVYTESLTSAELTDLFGKLCAEDAKISPRVFDVLHATPVVQADQEALRSILGIDPGLYKRPPQEKSSENAKPISAGTADQIVKSLTTGKGSEKSAVLTTWLPTSARTIPPSVELKQYLIKRGDRKANTVPAVIVIRPGNG